MGLLQLQHVGGGPTPSRSSAWSRPRLQSASLASLGICGQSMLSNFGDLVASNTSMLYVILHLHRIAFVMDLEKASPRRDEIGFDTLCRMQLSLLSAFIWALSEMSVTTSTSSSSQTRGLGEVAYSAACPPSATLAR